MKIAKCVFLVGIVDRMEYQTKKKNIHKKNWERVVENKVATKFQSCKDRLKLGYFRKKFVSRANLKSIGSIMNVVICKMKKQTFFSKETLDLAAVLTSATVDEKSI